MMHEKGMDVVFGYRVEISTQHELVVYLNGVGWSFFGSKNFLMDVAVCVQY